MRVVANNKQAGVGKGSRRSLVSLLLVLFFSTQSFLVQTHLHDLPKSFAPSLSTVTVSSQPDGQDPVGADKCLLCQEFTHSGGFVLPSAIAALPPSAAVSLLPFVVAPLGHARTASHIWMGRAPPHHA